MTFGDGKLMKENELTIIGKTLFTLLLIAFSIKALMNIFTGNVSNPYAFIFIVIGFLMFLLSKTSLFSKKVWLSLGTERMTESMANCYRVGYWLMIVGIILTF